MTVEPQLDKQDIKILRSFNRKHSQTLKDICEFTGFELAFVSEKIVHMKRSGILIAAAMADQKSQQDCQVNQVFSLTTSGERILPYLIHIEGREVGNLPIVVCAIVQDNYILLLKRVKRPYIGLIGMIGGKIQVQDSIKEAAEREVLEETGIKADYVKTCAILHERIIDNEQCKLGLVIFLTLLKPSEFDIIRIYSNEEGESRWYAIDDVHGDRFIPSDAYMIKNLLSNEIPMLEVIQHENKGEIGSTKFLK